MICVTFRLKSFILGFCKKLKSKKRKYTINILKAIKNKLNFVQHIILTTTIAYTQKQKQKQIRPYLIAHELDLVRTQYHLSSTFPRFLFYFKKFLIFIFFFFCFNVFYNNIFLNFLFSF